MACPAGFGYPQGMNELTKNVLVVDDDEDYARYLRRALTDAGYETDTAATAGLAAAMLRRKAYALVLADLRLPDGSGLDVLAEARRKDPLTVGLVLTGYGTVESAVEALREGAYDYLIKPCSPELLEAAAKRAHEHYELRLALLEKTAEAERLSRQLDTEARALQNVSHELKNPLSVVHGYSALLLNESCSPREVKQSLRLIHDNAQSLAGLIEDLLESVRIQGGKVTLNRRALQVSELCAQARDAHAPEAARLGITLSAAVDEPAWALADERRVRQILGNLIGNALKFTARGGEIVVVARREGCEIHFSVADTGRGMTREEVRQMFRRFYQADGVQQDHGGLGLGLEISRGIVELHGGRIWAESEPGRGTTLHFTLPACTP
jgi:two-component system, sensor histidine kinase and response regulator